MTGVPFTKNRIFKLTKYGLSPKGLCILRSVICVMVKTYDCSCNRDMYQFGDAATIIKALAEFYLEIFLLCLSCVLPWD